MRNEPGIQKISRAELKFRLRDRISLLQSRLDERQDKKSKAFSGIRSEMNAAIKRLSRIHLMEEKTGAE